MLEISGFYLFITGRCDEVKIPFAMKNDIFAADTLESLCEAELL